MINDIDSFAHQGHLYTCSVLIFNRELNWINQAYEMWKQENLITLFVFPAYGLIVKEVLQITNSFCFKIFKCRKEIKCIWESTVNPSIISCQQGLGYLAVEYFYWAVQIFLKDKKEAQPFGIPVLEVIAYHLCFDYILILATLDRCYLINRWNMIYFQLSLAILGLIWIDIELNTICGLL